MQSKHDILAEAMIDIADLKETAPPPQIKQLRKIYKRLSLVLAILEKEDRKCK